MSQTSLGLTPERKVFSVSELTGQVKTLLERAFRDLWVQGEISNFRVSPYGHYYFTLKDEAAQIRCFVWKKDAKFLRLQPADGLQVTLRGQLSLYEARGDTQIVVHYLEPVGVGALQAAFEQLKQRLEAEGLFAAERKKKLPLLPRRIGLVTSPRGAAIADIIRILRRRHENLHLLLYPVRVQGEGAAEEIVDAIQFFSRPEPVGRSVDVLLLARGGGSLEDLWAFNEERVARALAACPVPVVTGIGHETDFTIADFVADLRAPTPSAAAELVIQTEETLRERVRTLETKLAQQARYQLLRARNRWNELLAERGWRRLEAFIRERSQHADELQTGLRQALQAALSTARQRLTLAAARLVAYDLGRLLEHRQLRLRQLRGELGQRVEFRLLAYRKHLDAFRIQLQELSPIKVLERGYAIVFGPEGQVVKSAGEVRLGDSLAIRLAKGRLGAKVTEKKK